MPSSTMKDLLIRLLMFTFEQEIREEPEFQNYVLHKCTKAKRKISKLFLHCILIIFLTLQKCV